MTSPENIKVTRWKTIRETKVAIPIPDEKGKYFLCHPCVAERYCDYCDMEAGIPCLSPEGKYNSTHHISRSKGQLVT